MPNTVRCLVISRDDDLREELVERAIALNLSVRAIGLPEALPRLLQRYEFDWLIVDVGVGERDCLRIGETLAAEVARPRTILVAGKDQAMLQSVREAAVHGGMDVVGVFPTPLSLAQLRSLVEAFPAAGQRASERIDPKLGQVTAIPSEEIILHYQPIVAMGDRTIRRVEALVRWQHAQHGLIRPVRFIGMFERTDLITPLTWEVLKRAVDQHNDWKNNGVLLAVSVNISALFLTSPETADEILDLLHSRDCDPRHMILEITETEAAVNPSAARALLTKLHAAGMEIAMDDYGVGFSNLERLRYYPFSDLKIDRGLVSKLDSSQEARDIVAMLVSLAAQDNLALTGEGIETEGQWNILEQLGCDFGQGFLIARPMPADQVKPWIGSMTRTGRYRMPRSE
jgi:EAL domain-containing protein (putative c-di-GMP-specific phosphodiesterase class I)